MASKSLTAPTLVPTNESITKAPTTMTGGIAGSSRFVPESVPSIINSYNRSNIISEMSQFPPDSKRHPCSGITAGGIIGAAGGANIFYSYSTASEVSATPLANEDAYVGGIAGLMYGTQFQQNYYESNANVSVGIGGTITEDKEIVPQADIPSAVSPATQEDLKTKGFFDEGWQWYERGGDAPQFYSRTHPWRFTVEAGFANDGYPALRGNPNAQPPNQDLVAATNLVAKDPDNSYLGVDGRDFQVTWTPSVSSQTTGQSIFILPEDILLDTTIHQAIVVFADNTTKQWHGTADLKTDSAGNSLKGGNYIIYLISYNDEQSAQTSTIMTAISETSRSPGGGGSSDPTPIYSVTRLSGQNRVDTALEIAKAIYPKTVSNVVLATANTFPDALSGSVLAYKAKAPILLVGSSASDQEKILSYLESYLDKSGTVYILGGTSAVSQEMEGKIKLKGFNNITRLGGKDRYETALKIAEHLDLKSGTPLVFVNGENFSDALSISSTAAALQYPILLIQNNGISNSVKVKLSESKPTKVYLIGLEGVISKDLESQISQISTLDTANIVRIGGVNRYETSLAVVKAFKLSSHKICIATGNDFPDALLGSLYAANATAPMLLIDRTLSDNTLEYLKSQNFDNITIFGGEGAVKKEIEQKLLEAIKK
ncbi:MAG: cell wall-binding repeat-containing protein [Peptococcaceae bacterium]|nr:cell wall-binding repeat-containing protein [Peptococcaceae bacterium]